jgi:hypothetical protein
MSLFSSGQDRNYGRRKGHDHVIQVAKENPASSTEPQHYVTIRQLHRTMVGEGLDGGIPPFVKGFFLLFHPLLPLDYL